MAERRQKDLFARLADAGEEALTRLGSTPGTDRFVGALTTMRDQLEALTNRVRGLDALERRVEELERQVAKLSKPASASRSRTSSSSAAKKASGSTTRRSSSSSKKS